jgi:adenosine/AMP kinase
VAVDGASPLGLETEVAARKTLLREIGYKL